MSPTTIATWVADHGLDTVEPVTYVDNCFDAVVGAYTLSDDKVRVGGLHLVRANFTESCLKSIGFVSLPAVLDCRVVKKEDKAIAIAACADGTLRCIDLPSLDELWVLKHGAMLTSVSVVSEDDGDNGTLVSVSDASGGVGLVRVRREGFETYEKASAIHDAEAWTVHATDKTLVLSGGDDGYLRATDFRTSSPVWEKRAHNGVGVTTIVCRSETELWTGGYDDCVRVWDCRQMKRAVVEENVGGGVWRLKFHQQRPNLVLAACMYDGFKVLEANTKAGSVHSVAKNGEYREHESIAYGAAWLPGMRHSNNEGAPIALTASFYDKSLRLWNAQMSQ